MSMVAQVCLKVPQAGHLLGVPKNDTIKVSAWWGFGLVWLQICCVT